MVVDIPVGTEDSGVRNGFPSSGEGREVFVCWSYPTPTRLEVIVCGVFGSRRSPDYLESPSSSRD